MVSSYEKDYFQHGCNFWWICYAKQKNSQEEDKTSSTSQQVEFEEFKVDPASVDDLLSTEDEEEIPHDLDSIVYKRPRRKIRNLLTILIRWLIMHFQL